MSEWITIAFLTIMPGIRQPQVRQEISAAEACVRSAAHAWAIQYRQSQIIGQPQSVRAVRLKCNVHIDVEVLEDVK